MSGVTLVLLIIAYEITETWLRYLLARWLGGWCERNSAWCVAALRSAQAGRP